jgi:hypothetical protein
VNLGNTSALDTWFSFDQADVPGHTEGGILPPDGPRAAGITPVFRIAGASPIDLKE